MKPYRASVLAESTELAEFRRGFGVWLEAAELRSRTASELLLAAHEAVAHAMRRSAPAGFIGVQGVVEGGEVTIEVTSRGGWGDPGHRQDEQEHALVLIRGLVDQLLISSDTSGTRLKLRRSIVSAKLPPVLEQL
jgi:hypothetical protein